MMLSSDGSLQGALQRRRASRPGGTAIAPALQPGPYQGQPGSDVGSAVRAPSPGSTRIPGPSDGHLAGPTIPSLPPIGGNLYDRMHQPGHNTGVSGYGFPNGTPPPPIQGPTPIGPPGPVPYVAHPTAPPQGGAIAPALGGGQNLADVLRQALGMGAMGAAPMAPTSAPAPSFGGAPGGGNLASLLPILRLLSMFGGH